jgi:hypothetical protein
MQQGVRCTASGEERAVAREEWAQDEGTCPDCGGIAPFWTRATDLAPRLKIKAHKAPPGVTPAPQAHANALYAAEQEAKRMARPPVDPVDVTIITGYLNGARRAAREAQAALDGGDLDGARNFIDNLVRDVRQAEAAAEEAARSGDPQGGAATQWEAEHLHGPGDVEDLRTVEREAQQDR